MITNIRLDSRLRRLPTHILAALAALVGLRSVCGGITNNPVAVAGTGSGLGGGISNSNSISSSGGSMTPSKVSGSSQDKKTTHSTGGLTTVTPE
jgi:hypothetical protein